MALDKESGRIVWEYDIQRDGDQTSFHGEMLLTDEMLLIGTDTQIGHIYAFNKRTGAVAWKYRVPGSGAPTDILRHQSKIYTVVDDDVLICLDLVTGALQWQFQGEHDDVPHLFVRPAALHGDRIFYGGHAGVVRALDTDSGQLLWSRDIGAAITTSICANDSCIYFGTNDSTLFRLSQRSGEILSTRKTSGVPVGRPTFSEQGLYVLLGGQGIVEQGRARQLLSVDLRLARTLWELNPDFVWSAMKTYVWNRSLLTGTDSGEVIAYSLLDGSESWRIYVGGAVRSIGRSGNVLFVGTIEGRLYAVETADGG